MIFGINRKLWQFSKIQKFMNCVMCILYCICSKFWCQNIYYLADVNRKYKQWRYYIVIFCSVDIENLWKCAAFLIRRVLFLDKYLMSVDIFFFIYRKHSILHLLRCLFFFCCNVHGHNIHGHSLPCSTLIKLEEPSKRILYQT